MFGVEGRPSERKSEFRVKFKLSAQSFLEWEIPSRRRDVDPQVTASCAASGDSYCTAGSGCPRNRVWVATGCRLPVDQAAHPVDFTEGIQVRHKLSTSGKGSRVLDLKTVLRIGKRSRFGAMYTYSYGSQSEVNLTRPVSAWRDLKESSRGSKDKDWCEEPMRQDAC